ncbi:hypothetical protein ANN_18371 [Periplaneta americana]|uniref:Uncharacterized protein n=1 Tax=Periplaneta americana TaxID=6978 RepID=A0ABQ8SP73_PERAM|nr:hypothetical protein ANN_18371 [Periplaneta americana]
MGDSGTFSVLIRYDPCDYELFTEVKEPLRGTRYNTRDELICALGQSIRNINKDGRADGVRRLPNIWKKVINKGGDYIEAVTGRAERSSSADFFEESAPPGDVAMVQTIKCHTPPIFPCGFHSNVLFFAIKMTAPRCPSQMNNRRKRVIITQ